MTEPVLRVLHVQKTYPGRFGRPAVHAVRDIDFSVAEGEILGLLGPNGAGKSTTIKMVAGLLLPSGGEIRIGELDVARQRSRAARQLGAVLEGNRNLHWKLTAEENLHYFGALKGVRDVQVRTREVLDQLDMAPHRLKRVGELSRGLQQRVAIGVALLTRPRLLLLDEPTLGLDVVSASTFQEVVRGIASEGCAIVLTTHQMEVAQALSRRIAIIANGELAALDSLTALQSAYRTPGYALTVRGTLDEPVTDSLVSLGAESFSGGDGLTRFALREGAALYRAIAVLGEAGVELVRVEQQEVDLEEIYRRIVENPA